TAAGQAALNCGGARFPRQGRGRSRCYARSEGINLLHDPGGASMTPLVETPGGAFPFSPRAHRATEIPWREWGEAALAEALESDRPVVLSVVTTWSTEAHRMDEDAFSSQRVIDLLADQFIPMRVDADERPDVA